MLKRKAEKILDKWKDSKDALLVTGARQVGKSYLIREYGQTHFKSFIEINLYEHQELIPLLERHLNAKDFLFRLSVMFGGQYIEHETLIFFDEIQYAEHCDLITLAKFLVEDGRYRYIFSGSLLGVALKNIASWPVGYMRTLKMYPLDFEEFLWSNGLQESAIDYLRECFDKREPVDGLIHNKIMDLFYKYLLIGGLPEVVNTYLSTNNLANVDDAQEKINDYYKNDITKYAPIEQRIHLETIYDTLPSELNSKNKRFTVSEIGNQYSIKNIQDDFMWLKKAGVAVPTYNIDEPTIPLLLSANHRLVKLFSSDIGILCHELMNTQIKYKILKQEKDINYGSIFENAVAEELTAHGFENLFYYNSKKQGEVDFMIEYHGNILPIEVKSGKDYKTHSALDNLLNNNQYDIPQAIILNNYNIEVNSHKIYLPIYMVMFIQKVDSLELNDLKLK